MENENVESTEKELIRPLKPGEMFRVLPFSKLTLNVNVRMLSFADEWVTVETATYLDKYSRSFGQHYLGEYRYKIKEQNRPTFINTTSRNFPNYDKWFIIHIDIPATNSYIKQIDMAASVLFRPALPNI